MRYAPAGFQIDEPAVVAAMVEAGVEVEVFQPGGPDGGGGPRRVTGVRHFPAWEGQRAGVAITLDGAGFMFAGPGAVPMAWRKVVA